MCNRQWQKKIVKRKYFSPVLTSGSHKANDAPDPRSALKEEVKFTENNLKTTEKLWNHYIRAYTRIMPVCYPLSPYKQLQTMILHLKISDVICSGHKFQLLLSERTCRTHGWHKTMRKTKEPRCHSTRNKSQDELTKQRKISQVLTLR